MEIAVNGIDGCGKSTFIEEARALFEGKGFSVSVIDFPYFRRTPGLSSLSPYLEKLGDFIEKQSRILFAIYMFCLSFLYWVAKVFPTADLVLVEHHPRIDLPPYGCIYGGRIGEWTASLLCRLWPRPDAVLVLTLAPEEAYRRIKGRGRKDQWRQTPERLGRVQELLCRQARTLPGLVGIGRFTPEDLYLSLEKQGLLMVTKPV